MRLPRTLVSEVHKKTGERVRLQGWSHKTRNLGNVVFLVLRDRTGLCQVVFEGSEKSLPPNEACCEVVGIVRKEDRAPGGVELAGETVKTISSTAAELPIQINTKTPVFNLDTALNHRALSLRHRQLSAVFNIETGIVKAFSEYLNGQGFNRIFTPKIVGSGTEGGSELFSVQYFDKPAYLAQSPQFYKQIMVGVFERVYEVGHAYRAEEHNTSRHLNEYVSLDVEMGFIESYDDLMALEESLLQAIFAHLIESYSAYLDLLSVDCEIPAVPFPRITLSEAAGLIKDKFGKSTPPGNLDPEGERLISRYIKETFGSDFVFITKYPKNKRPMYATPSSENTELTDSFDLLFKGLEITTGGQRIHEYKMLKESIIAKGLDPDSFTSYLEPFKFGIPPHGGFAIGLERFACQILSLGNVREASLFPRDRERLTP